MKFHFTGTGTSQGIPVIGCTCPTCTSVDPRDRRLRTAAYIETEDVTIGIDAGPDFRQQMLNVRASSMDALLLTHEHNDHIAGLDDIRPFNFRQGASMQVYALPRVARDVRKRFAYIFAKHRYPGAPSIDLIEVEPYKELRIKGLKIIPFVVWHGRMEVLGYRIGGLSYITDANRIPSATEGVIRGSTALVLNALHHRSHHSHFNLEEALAVGETLEAGTVYFTHISHQMGLHAHVQPDLPEGFQLAYDGLELDL